MTENECLDRTSRDVVLKVSSWSRLGLVALTSRSRLETITPMSRSRLVLRLTSQSRHDTSHLQPWHLVIIFVNRAIVRCM